MNSRSRTAGYLGFIRPQKIIIHIHTYMEYFKNVIYAHFFLIPKLHLGTFKKLLFAEAKKGKK